MNYLSGAKAKMVCGEMVNTLDMLESGYLRTSRACPYYGGVRALFVPLCRPAKAKMGGAVKIEGAFSTTPRV